MKKTKKAPFKQFNPERPLDITTINSETAWSKEVRTLKNEVPAETVGDLISKMGDTAVSSLVFAELFTHGNYKDIVSMLDEVDDVTTKIPVINAPSRAAHIQVRVEPVTYDHKDGNLWDFVPKFQHELQTQRVVTHISSHPAYKPIVYDQDRGVSKTS